MRKITTYLFALLFASATFMACDDQFAGQYFADPTVNEQGAQQIGDGFALALASDFATPIVLSEENMEENTLFQAIRMSQTPTILGENVEFRFRLEVSDTNDFENVLELPSISENSIALVSAEDLAATVVEFFGAAPNARTMYVRISAVLVDGTVTVRIPGQAVFPVTVTPLAPIIEEAYFLIGAFNGWNIGNLEPYRFSHSGRDVYEDPIFTILVPRLFCPDDDINGYFRIIPLSGQLTGDWSTELGNPINGNTELTGTIVYGGGAMRVVEPGWVRITLNMLERTYTIEIIGEMALEVFVPGSHQGWSPATAPALFARNFDFRYFGYVFFEAGDQFKFTHTRDWTQGFGGAGTPGVLQNDPSSNLNVAETGLHRIVVDLSGTPWTYTLELTNWGIIGSSTPGGWSTSTPMNLDPATGLLTITVDLVEGYFKFRANDDWAINLGGDLNNQTYGGADIRVDVAGTYLITLDLRNPQAYTASFVLQ